MDCKRVKELLTAYQDGTLLTSEISEIKAHLHGCQDCQKEERLLAKTWEMINILPSIEPSPNFRVRFWEKVREEEEKRTNWWSIPRLVPAMLGFVGVWVVGVSLGSFLFLKSQQGIPDQRPALQTILFSDASNLERAYLKRMSGENL